MISQALKDKIAAYWELTKPGITTLVLVSTSLGFYLGSKTVDGANWWLMIPLLIGSALSSGGVATLNEYWERVDDSRMNRTKHRPIPSGRLTAREALVFGLSISTMGIGILTLLVHPGTGLMALLTLVSYIFIYTPLKKRTTWNTIIGSVPGALPPIGGWLAVTGAMAPGAWALFLIMFAWQVPHFLAIATIYKEDYRAGGMKMLPTVDETGRSTAFHIIIFCLMVLGASMLPTYYNLTGLPYLIGATALGLILLGYGISAAQNQVAAQAKKLMFASIIYLPALLVVMVIDLEFFG